MSAAEKSKILAEKACWNFVEEQAVEKKLDLVTLEPGFVLGPCLITEEFASGDFLLKLLNNKFKGMPRLMVPTVDVRDVALAHLRAIEVEGTGGNRFVLAGRTTWLREIGEIVKEEFEPHDYKIPA